jgi:hypothetical protein
MTLMDKLKKSINEVEEEEVILMIHSSMVVMLINNMIHLTRLDNSFKINFKKMRRRMKRKRK